jgi:hypothetical protein
MDLDRILALKIPHANLLTSRADLERFYRGEVPRPRFGSVGHV